MLKKVFKYLLAGLFLFSGINHFINPQVFTDIMPPYLPFHLELVYLSGLFEILCGAGLFIRGYRKIASWGIVLMLMAFFPVHFYMYSNPEKFSDIPESLLLVRIFLQFGLIYLAFTYTRINESNSSASL